MAPIIPAPTDFAAEDRDKTSKLDVDVTLAVANTSEPLFTVPVGFVARSFSFVNETAGPASQSNAAFVSAVTDAAATLTDTRIEKRETWYEDGLELPAGDYEFIGEVGKTPRMTGVVWLSAV